MISLGSIYEADRLGGTQWEAGMGLAFGFECPALLSQGACACVSAAVGVHTHS